MCQVPLLTELEELKLSTRYKHFAPNGAEAVTSELPRELTADSAASASAWLLQHQHSANAG